MAVTGFLAREKFQDLLNRLSDSGYRIVGPQIRDGAIVYEPLQRTGQLPLGARVEQAPGRYHLSVDHAQPRCFAWANGPQALKPLLFPPQELLWHVERKADGRLHFIPAESDHRAMAVMGVRACDVAALAMHDQHFDTDPNYQSRRGNLFTVAVNCTHPAATCFCASTGDGPQARSGYDLLLDELDDGYLVYSGTLKGEEVSLSLELATIDEQQLQQVREQNAYAVAMQTRSLPSSNLHDTLFANLEHPRWQAVAERCLACGNCTSVCPTCFCHSEFEQGGIDLNRSEHVRQWQSCFGEGHSYLHGMQVRPDIRSRYRQWLTHKLAGWHEQFGRSGCVGCGRCISWCPVGIDITDEVAVICGGGEA